MNILVINGSPHGENGNTWCLTRTFLAGIADVCTDTPPNLETAGLYQMKIHPCRGCYTCWRTTPGECTIRDDMAWLLEKILWADVTIWSFPLYYSHVPGLMKTVIDRGLPLQLPDRVSDPDHPGLIQHPPRYDLSGKRTVLISTCGFYKPESVYGGVYALFDRLCGKNGYEALLFGPGELLQGSAMQDRIDKCLSLVRTAGQEFARGAIGLQTHSALRQPLLSRDEFEKMSSLTGQNIM